MKRTKLVSLLVLVVFLFTLAVPGAAMASDRLEVEQGQTFKVPMACDCDYNDGGYWYIECESYNVCQQYMDTDHKVITFYASEPGRDTIHLRCGDCNAENYISVTVNAGRPADIGLYLDESNITLMQGEEGKLNAYWNDPAAQTDMRWTSSDESVIRINGNAGSCYYTAVGEGRANVTVTDRISGNSASCYFRVNAGQDWEIEIVGQPSSANYNRGDNPRALVCEAMVTSPSGERSSRGITYQWYSGSSYRTCSNRINGATDSYYYPDTYESGTTYYACVATYSIGSVDCEVATTPVSVNVAAADYGIYISADTSTVEAGKTGVITARVYDSRGNIAPGNYRVNWEVSNTRVATMENYTTVLNNGRGSNVLFAMDSPNNNSVNVTAYVTINGVTYQDTIPVNIKGVPENYTITVTSSSSSIVGNQTADLVATLYRNGNLVTNSSPTVTWSLRNANNFAALSFGTSSVINGRAVNTLKTLQHNSDATTSVTAVATVTINGNTYSGTTNVLVRPTSTQGTGRIVMQINNKNIVVDNATITNDVAPLNINGRTMVPIRVVTELLNGTADFNNNVITLKMSNGKMLSMTVGQELPGFGVAPMIIDSRTYVPIRYVAENLGAKVDWVDATQQIIITR